MRTAVIFKALLALVIFSFAPCAFAQSPYVEAALGLDVLRTDRVDAPGAADRSADGEALAFSLRLGTSIGQNWGVELGFTRPNEIERENLGPFPLLSANTAALFAVPAGTTSSGYVIPAFNTTVERRHTTLETVAWVSQRVSTRVDLVYVGGLAFNRVVEEARFQFTRAAVGIIVPNSTRTISYSTGPVAGFEARIALTDHVRLVPGVRLQTIGGAGTYGWLLRAATGIGWQF